MKQNDSSIENVVLLPFFMSHMTLLTVDRSGVMLFGGCLQSKQQESSPEIGSLIVCNELLMVQNGATIDAPTDLVRSL